MPLRRRSAPGSPTDHAKGTHMTASVEEERRLRALRPPAPVSEELGGSAALLQWVKVFAAVTGMGGSGTLTAALCLDEVHVAFIASTAVVLSAIACAVLVGNALLADRLTFYERGKADGWYEGWKGVPPTTEHPFLRR
jgi:hypothetical protein